MTMTMDEQRVRGKEKIEWAVSRMDLLNRLRDEFLEERPFAGHRIGMSIHLEAKTACLAILLRDGGAKMFVTGSNPLSTQDDIATALAYEDGISVYARHGVSEAEYTAHLEQVLAAEPDLILDDGGDLVRLLHERIPRDPEEGHRGVRGDDDRGSPPANLGQGRKVALPNVRGERRADEVPVR
jgi:adenosylhomocysteinase